MKFFSNNIMVMFLVFALAVIFYIPAHATDMSLNATIASKAAISATTQSEMNFGEIIYEPSHSGHIILDTRGNVFVDNGSYGLAVVGSDTSAGEILLSGADNTVVEVSCEQNARLSSQAGDDLILSDVELSINGGVAFGSGTKCNGLGNVAKTFELKLGVMPKILIGGRVNIATDTIASSTDYSTAKNGGDPVTIRMTYQ